MLSGPEQLVWRDALFKAFSEQEFTELLWYRLDRRVGEFASANRSWAAVVGAIVDAYSRRDEEDLLIAKAAETRPRNPGLLRLASTKKAAVAPDDASLEQLIQESNSFLNLSTWLEAAGKLQVCICRIEIAVNSGAKVFGTGFLIAADLVMTNWHVVRCIAALEDNDQAYPGPRARAADAVCRFDYKVLSGGTTNPGLAVSLAPSWRVALSPNNANGREPQPDLLDCAVIRLSQPLGNLVVGDRHGIPGDRRGWVSLPAMGVAPDFSPRSPLFIMQHPQGDPIKLALSTDAIQAVNANRTRVKYSTNTERGSSGSPCFDQNWNLVALHHAGDPNFAPDHPAEFNEGIPIDAIVRFLNERGLVDFGQVEP
ncbi:MAG TPA: trypsin-like peptidase domain-containing protein [Candidatus Acidoferrales bacterium]|jgi:hypothetical protein|nr:trypsin-like peptidase domain-containing protein [Candidatus Acidoferrales bacterium]